jgi:gas vesicle protein GvpN
VHLRGPAGTGKTTLALHLADLVARPIMLIFGDDEFKTSDLIGNQSGYTRKKVVDNFIHSVVKVEDELRQNWVDSRLTLACREGFTLVYDEFNRSRPEVNNVLLSALEEKLLVLPPSNNRSEYIRVSPNFRAIFTSNPEEYCGVHATQDALLDRLVTINMPEPDELTQQEILVQKTEIDRASAVLIVRLVKEFRMRTKTDKASGLRSCLMIAKVCQEHEIFVLAENSEFRDVCCDVLLSRSSLPYAEATTVLWDLLNEMVGIGLGQSQFDDLPVVEAVVPSSFDAATLTQSASPSDSIESIAPIEPIEALITPEKSTLAEATTQPEQLLVADESAEPIENPASLWDERPSTVQVEEELPVETELEAKQPSEMTDTTEAVEASLEADHPLQSMDTDTTEVLSVAVAAVVPHEREIYAYIESNPGAKLSQVEKALRLDRFQTVDALRSLTEQGRVVQRDRLFFVNVEVAS